jgi:segregation and condensation protein A
MTTVSIEEDGLLAQLTPCTVELPVFEGPLDLLLFLIKNNELNIYDIPIESITGQYLKVLSAMDQVNLTIAGEFFVMASTLMYIKSCTLLPTSEKFGAQREEEEDAINLDPRWELVEQLLQYKEIKYKALELDCLIQKHGGVVPCYFPQTETVPADQKSVLAPIDKLSVWCAFNQLMQRLKEHTHTREIHAETISIAERMETLLTLLDAEEAFLFSSALPESASTTLVVATFLGALELCRLSKLALQQAEPFGDIYCKRREMLENSTSFSMLER